MYYLKADITTPVNFISAGHFTADTRWIHSQRIISDYEIIINLKSPIYIQQEETKYTLNSGDSLLLLPGLTHKGFRYSEKGTSFYWFHFSFNNKAELLDSSEAEAMISMINNNSFFEGLGNICLLPAIFRADNPDRLTILFHQLLHLSASAYYSRLAIHYQQTSLLIELTQENITQLKPQQTASLPADKLPKILEWIRIHILQDISLQDVSHEFNYSREYLARYFKKHMGMSMQQYIYNLKLAKAKELLCESDKNIREIAEVLGFKDEKYFMKLFKRMEGTTPKQYRNAYNRTHMNNN